MAIKSNDSTQEVIGGIKTFSGLTNVNVLAVNPTMAELHAMDINVKQEPNYDVAFSDQEFKKITFWLANADGNFKLEILVNNTHKESKTGKFQWINNIGQVTWSTDAPSYDWWKSEGQRKAYTGEETLINFVKAWANVANGDDVSFDTISSIVTGDVTEIKALLGALKSNQVRVLIGVKDDKYQQVYTKYFGRVKPQRDDLFVKSLNDDYGAFNADFNADLKWGTHTPTTDLISPDAPAEDDDWTMPQEPVAVGSETTEDTPF